MSFVNSQYFIYIIITYIVLMGVLFKINKGYFKWIKTYWFFEQSNWNKISNFLYGLAIFLFLVSLLDLRGPEMKVRASLPDQRTIIILDSSLSMLCEDVRPSRFVKSIQLARHFIKRAAGHQVAIVLFSDLQKRLIPFTDDIDLLDSRLAALEKANSVSGGTNITQAITEAASYFESDTTEGEKDGGGGNILVFTDAEEGDENFKLDISNNINLGVVGVGTVQGGNIPLRWEDGSFRGYKTVKNEMVTTRLDENYIKSLGKNAKNFRYWIANSYSLPTEEIMDFFRATYNQKHNTGDLRVRPVFSHYILIPAILIYCLGVLFGRLNSFRTIKALLVICLLTGSVFADEETRELPPEIKKDLRQIRKGAATRTEILKTAEKLLKAKEDQKASELYNEYSGKNDEEEVRFNHATSLLKSGRTKEALPIVQELLSNSKNENLKNKMRNNLTVAVKKQKEKKEQQDKKDKEEKQDDKKDDKKDENDKKDNKDEKKQGQNKDEKKQENKQDKSSEGKDDKKSGGKEEDKKEDKKKSEKDKDKKDEKEGSEGDKPEEQKPQTLEQKEKEIEQKRKMTKTPGMIKQIMNNDRELQKKLMDTTTKDKAELKPKRDW